MNSGAVVLAMTLRRPVLVPDLGSMREQQDNFGADWIRLYEGELSGRELEAAIAWAAHATSRSKLDLERLSWRALAEKTRNIYDTLLAVRAGAPTDDAARGGRLRCQHEAGEALDPVLVALSGAAQLPAESGRPVIVANAVILLDSWLRPKPRMDHADAGEGQTVARMPGRKDRG